LKGGTKIFELNLKKLNSKLQFNKIQEKFNADFLSLRCNFKSWHEERHNMLIKEISKKVFT